ncbi:ABC transporter permease [Paenibacillus sp. CAU 1782]
MNALATLILGELRRKKAQSLLMVLLLLLSTWLSATSIILMNQSQSRFQYLFDISNAPHEMVILDSGRHDPDEIYSWWQSRSEAEPSSLLPYRTLNNVSLGDETISNLYVYMINTPAGEQRVDKLQFVQGEQRELPQPGTVWLPSSLAYGSGIKIGDTLSFGSGDDRFQLKISAIVIDIPFGAPFSTTARIWMNPQDYKVHTVALGGDERYMFGIRYQDYSQNISLWDELASNLGKPYLESKISYDEIISFYLVMNKLIGFIMMVLGIIMLMIALVTIGFTISDAILAQYRKIGILKALGMTSSGTTLTYVFQYTFLALLGVVPGVLLSGATSKMIVDLTLSNLKTGTNGFGPGDIFVLVAVGSLILLLTACCSYAYARKTAAIMPAQAIRYGMSEKDSSRSGKSANASGGTWPRFDRYPFFAAIGLRHLKQNRRGSALIAIIAITSSAAITLGFVLVTSLLAIHQTAGKWGYDNADISVAIVNDSSFSRDSFNTLLQADDRIASFGWVSGATGVFSSGEPGSVSVSILEGSYDRLGFETLEGRNPGNRNEIAIGIKVAESRGLHIGDRMELYIGGKKVSLLVSGIYQAISNRSQSARITSDVLPLHETSTGITDAAAFIQLKDGVSADHVAQELQGQYRTELTVETQKSLLDSVFKEAVDSLLLPMFFVGLLFLGVSAIIVYSICRIGIRTMLKTYGIYKTIGLTSRSIRLSISTGIALLSAAGAIIGAITGIWLLTSLLELVLLDYGLAELPLVLQWPGIVVAASLSILPAFAGSWLSSRILDFLSPRELVIE